MLFKRKRKVPKEKENIFIIYIYILLYYIIYMLNGTEWNRRLKFLSVKNLNRIFENGTEWNTMEQIGTDDGHILFLWYNYIFYHMEEYDFSHKEDSPIFTVGKWWVGVCSLPFLTCFSVNVFLYLISLFFFLLYTCLTIWVWFGMLDISFFGVLLT